MDLISAGLRKFSTIAVEFETISYTSETQTTLNICSLQLFASRPEQTRFGVRCSVGLKDTFDVSPFEAVGHYWQSLRTASEQTR